MIRRAALVAGVAATLALTACGDDASSDAAEGSGGGKDTVAGCVEAFNKTMEEASKSEDFDPNAVDDEPPPECDDLSTEDQQKAIQQSIEAALGDLGNTLDELGEEDPELKKEIEDAIKQGAEEAAEGNG